jgi:Glycosyl transferase family 2
MKLVMTLVVRDEEDIVDAQISYHLNAGVDFVIATDHESQDGTTEILEGYERAGKLQLIAEYGPNEEAAWRTRMARLAATDFGADWVINTDADEFWIPREGTLKECLSSIPPRYGIIHALSRHFPPRPDDGAFFAERMTVRVSFPVAINDPTSPYRPHAKVAHRADPEIVVIHGAHGAKSARFAPLYDWYPSEVFHFPFRTFEQWRRKGVRRARADKPLGQYLRALHAAEQGRAEARYGSLVVDDATLERGLAAGCLAVDVRLRNALRAGSTVEESDSGGALLAESAGVQEADIVRLFRHTDEVVARLVSLESRSRNGVR